MKAPLAPPETQNRVRARQVGIGILGATGYAGAELVRILASHPHATLKKLSSRQNEGERFAAAFPALPPADLVLEGDPGDPGPWISAGVEIVFAALPHGSFAARGARFLDAGIRVVDLSADFRLTDPEEYQRRYGLAHPDPALLAQAAYGLTEWCGAELEDARLVANPGCYATAVLLSALPPVSGGWWNGEPILVNALSGVSGAGRAPSLATHFVECGNSAAPYKVGEVHAHLGEMTQMLRRHAPCDAFEPDRSPIVFSPHLVPIARGILASAAIPLKAQRTPAEAQMLFTRRYGNSAFVRVLEGGALPETRHVRGSNRCDLAVRLVSNGRLLLVFAAIDNLVKGAAGQAVQNWNRMMGWPETTGLPLGGWPCA